MVILLSSTVYILIALGVATGYLCHPGGRRDSSIVIFSIFWPIAVGILLGAALAKEPGN